MLNSEAHLPVSLLHELLSLDPETGHLFWKPREEKHFKDTGSRTASHAAANWNSRYAGARAMTAKQGSGHLHGRIFNKRYYAHRIVYAMTNGHWPLNSIDHINGDPTDNRPKNLRDVVHRTNHQNQKLRKNNTSGVTGVSYNKRLDKWCAHITIKNKYVHIGFFKNKEDAANARAKANKDMGFHPNHGRTAA